MTLKIKLPLMVITVVVATSLVLLLLATESIRRSAAGDLARIREEKTAQVKQDLTDKVDTVYALLDAQYQEASRERYLTERYGQRLEAILDVAAVTLRRFADKVRAGELPLERAQREALATIKAMRFDEGRGYIWINDDSLPYPRMVMHPTLPELDGQVLDSPEFDCARDGTRNLFREAVLVGRERGSGFVKYLWPEPSKDGLIPRMPKLSHVRLFAEWGWVLGTGIYVDEALREKVAETTEDIRKIRYGREYFWINDSERPDPGMVMHPLRPELEGATLGLPEFELEVNGRRQNLFAAFRDLAERDGSGFAEYLWPKPDADGKLGPPQPKLSFVRLYRPLGWVIGTGRYVDDIERDIAAKSAAVERQVGRLIGRISLFALLIMVLAVLAVSLIARSITEPLAHLARHTKDIAEDEQHLSRRVGLRSNDEIGTLAAGFDLMAARIEKSLGRMRAQRELLSSVLSSLPHSIFWKDRNGVYLGCNERFARLAGLPAPEAIVGRSDRDLGWAAEEAESLQARDRAVLESGEPARGARETHRGPGGEPLRYLVSRVPLRDQGGNLIGLLGVLVELEDEAA